MSPIADLSFTTTSLPCYRVAMARGFGPSPEMDAWRTLLEWAERRRLDPVGGDHRFFGFNDPSPDRPGEPYGYQQWMTVTADVTADPHEDVEILCFAGGRFATTRCEGLTAIADRWRELHDFAVNAGLEPTHEPGLEELLTPPSAPVSMYVFDLYLPVANA